VLTLKIAWRNIFRQKRRTVLTVLTMFGGFTLSALSIGWADGTYNRIIEMFTRNRLGHVQIHAAGYLDKPSLYRKIDDFTRVGDIVENTEGVMAWTPRLYSAGLASVGEKAVARSDTRQGGGQNSSCGARRRNRGCFAGGRRFDSE